MRVNLTFGGGIKRMLNEEYKKAKADFGIITSLPFGGEGPESPEEEEAVIMTYDRSGKAHQTWIGSKKEPTFAVNLTHAQRKVLADVLPALADRLKTAEAASRTIHFTLKEVGEIAAKCQTRIPRARGAVRNSLRHITEAAAKAIENSQGIGGIPAAERVYQFRIKLKGIKPPIWRRIQTKDCTLDKLHEHIQTAMGWTNSHLHQFKIDGVIHGDPGLLYEGWQDETPPVNSRRLKISKILPKDGKRFVFTYEYDFGDGWEHEVLFEGCLRAETGTRYPLCVEGERACPPEDVGGIGGYKEYLKTLSDPDNKGWDEMSDWRGPYRPEHFDAQTATKEMRKGLPNWREME